MTANFKKYWGAGAFVAALLVGCGGNSGSDSQAKFETKAALGAALYSDVNLSKNRTQSCATCHGLENGLADNRNQSGVVDGAAFAASLGDDGVSFGDRNAPSASYMAFSPSFKQGTRERVASQSSAANIPDYEGFLGGQFWDGREADLAGQAGGPPTNPIEMGMESKAAVVERIMENADYVAAFESLFGADVFDDAATEDPAAYTAMAQSIAEFEKTDAEQFYRFSSKYDRTLTDDFTFDPAGKVALGKVLFFSSDLTCASCHQLRENGNRGEIFTSFEYHNIGVPANQALKDLRESLGLDGAQAADLGLFNNPNVTAVTEKGKFKVPTLRNVAVTAPYMHNGVFAELETVIKFYEHARSRALNSSQPLYPNNPETDQPWATPEVADNINHDLLGGNDISLDAAEVEALVCFLISLTDAQYEHLLDADKVASCGL